MLKNIKSLPLVLIILVSTFLRFFNLLHDAPYFFNPDERNMAIAISQFRLPNKLSKIPICLISQISPILTNQQAGNPAKPDLASRDCNLNPHFFAYGQFPLYLAFVSDQISSVMLNSFQHPNGIPDQVQDDALSTSHPSAIFWLRFWSALSSVLTVLLVYLISKELFDNLSIKLSSIPALLAAFSPGLIQSAHFGTTESLLTFFFLASTYFSIRLLQSKPHLSYLSNLKYALILSIIVGLAIGTKFTGIIFLAPPLLSLMIQIIRAIKGRKKNKIRPLLLYSFIALLLISGSVIFSIISSPFNLIDLPGFKGSVFGYEADVATGKYEAFYTRQFVDTTPVLFQMEKIFPYALGWPIFILGFLGFLSMSINILSMVFLFIFQGIKCQVSCLARLISAKRAGRRVRIKRKKQELNILNTYFVILTTSFLFYFLPNAFLFAKWTRFMTPIFPFFSIFAGYLLFQIYQWLIIAIPKIQKSKIKNQKLVKSLNLPTLRLALIFALCTLSLLPGAAFMSIYTHEDSRVTASRWIWQNIPDKSFLLFETANVIDIPLGIPGEKLPEKNFPMVSFDYYHIDDNKELFDQLLSYLEKADYILIPSRRIFANYLRLPKRYPLVTKYYQLLYSGALGFEKVADFSSFPQLTISPIGPIRLIGNDESAEESSTVFDHPVIRIYKKNKLYNFDYYRNLFI